MTWVHRRPHRPRTAGIDIEDTDRCSATILGDDGQPRYLWRPLDLEDVPTYTAVIAHTIAERNRWRTQYEDAKRRAGPADANSATQQAARQREETQAWKSSYYGSPKPLND